jgi:hypothetical protein
MSVSYFLVLLLATLCSSCKQMPKPQQFDSLEGEYLRRLEEGFSEVKNRKEE